MKRRLPRGCLPGGVVLLLLASGVFVLATPFRRVAWVRAEHERELAEERLRGPSRRPVLRGTPASGELVAGLRHALEGVSPLTSDFMVLAKVRNGRAALDSSLVPRALAVVPPIRAALQREVVDLPLEPAHFHIDQIFTVEIGFALTLRHRVEEGALEDAASLALDHWRFVHDLERDPYGRGFPLSDPSTRLAPIVAAATSSTVDRIVRELSLLEDTASPFAETMRRSRISFGAGWCSVLDGKNHWNLELPSNAFATALFVKRHWEEPHRESVWLETTVRNLPTHQAWRRTKAGPSFAPAKWEETLEAGIGQLFGNATICYGLGEKPLAKHLDDLARLRSCRILAATRRFALAHARLPRTIEEAVGRAPDEREADPYDGSLLRFVVTEREVTVYSIGRDERDDGGAIGGRDPKDVGVSLPR